jgi:hypothetical protein
MRWREVIAGLTGTFAGWPLAGAAQPTKVYRIGYLGFGTRRPGRAGLKPCVRACVISATWKARTS